MAQELIELMRSCGVDPREVTFAAPWEARAFALAVALAERGILHWEEFRDRLITAISQADAAVVEGAPAASYYECWLAALEETVRARALANTVEIDASAAHITAHPPARTKARADGPIKIA